jgi:sugar phosphate isomerase/epimerase
MFDGFAPEALRGKPRERTLWAEDQVKLAAKASRNLGINVHATFSGSLMWHTVYPWPQRPKGLVEEGFKELAKRWLPILNVFDNEGVDACYEVHAGEDLHDGITFERFWEATGKHPRVNLLYDPSHFVLQQLDYLQYIDHYHSFIKMFHVKDAEYNPSGKSGVYGGFQDWIDRPGRFRSLGDGQVNFKSIFSRLAQYNYAGWAVLEWECCIKHPEQGAAEGAPFIRDHIIRVTEKAFDDFASAGKDDKLIKNVLGLNQ